MLVCLNKPPRRQGREEEEKEDKGGPWGIGFGMKCCEDTNRPRGGAAFFIGLVGDQLCSSV